MELIDIYDDCGEKSGMTEERAIVHKKALLHKSICVWIMNAKNEILLQRRSSQVFFPNLLDASFSGHIQAGESSIETVRREGREELGIEIKDENLKYLFSCREYDVLGEHYENEIDEVFLYREDIPLEKFSFADHEVSEVFYVSLDAFKKLVLEEPHLLISYKEQYQFLLIALNIDK